MDLQNILKIVRLNLIIFLLFAYLYLFKFKTIYFLKTNLL